jgi:cell division protein FtsI/penicillin-binding protein 2
MKKRRIGGRDRRPAIVGGVLLLLAAVFVLAVVRNQFFGDKDRQAPGGGQKEEQVSGVRGSGRRNIYDRNFMELAVSFQRSSLYARPLELDAPEEVAREVAKILELNEKDIHSALKGERSFAWLGRVLSPAKAAKIADLNLKGVYRINQVQRFYPENQLGAHVIGFLKDEQGLAGVEFFYDSVLRGGGVYDPRLAAAGVSKEIAAGSDSASLILTLDIHLQNVLEQKLENLVQGTAAKAGVAVLMALDTGEIIGLASLPDYDPNRFWEFSTESRRNRAVEDHLDLGAMGHLFQAAAVMDRGIIQPKNEVSEVEAVPDTEVEPEEIRITAWNAVEEDRYISPEGLGFVQTVVGHDAFNLFAERIGLTAKGEVDLPETLFGSKDERVGTLDKVVVDNQEEKFPDSPGAILPQADKDAFLTATPLALLSSFCRLINGGQAMTPHVLRAVWQDEQVWAVPAREGIGEFVVRPQVSVGMWEEMKKAAGIGRENFVIESLLRKEFAPQSPIKTTAESEVEKGPEGGAEAVTVQPAMESILLGTAPLDNPQIAIIVVLDSARIDPLGKSPVRDFAEEMMRQARTALRNQVKPPTARELAVREVGYYKKMEMVQAEAVPPAALVREVQALVMPDVQGLSGRKAMRILQPYGLRIQIVGTGQVARQYPLAGAALRGVEQSVLHLKPMQ